ncbi:acetyl-CoA decarbonylase/synthase complex subunit alpha/beta [Desulfothermobacter acidiphilus]|uniref:acetyl-CoA decarbonylase/synthase complex subunit alpha/beta n=1 Tax=Desulfothermobacter acidiphilus TaxID=1938353 RepID=UPI003F8BD3D4
MSRIIAAAAIRGAHRIASRAEEALQEALAKYGPDHPVAFPNTGYYLPVIYGVTGVAVEKIGDMIPVMERVKALLPPEPESKLWLPYLGPALDAGMATLFADEIIEALKYLEESPPYTMTSAPRNGTLWLGAADDAILRKRGIEFVDGTAPGFAAIVGAAPTNEIAVQIARELQEKSLYVFMSAATNGKSMAEQLAEEGVELGWDTRLVPFGKDITATVFSLGFATRVALSFGNVKPGDFRRVLLYNKNRVFAFVIALGEVDDEKYAQAAGAINFGFPTIADTDIPQILPYGVCTYEHVVSSVPHEKIVSRAIEVRGLKITVAKVPVPVAYGPAFEGESVRKGDMQVEFGGQRTPAFELVRTREAHEVEDGRIEVVGPEADSVPEGGKLPLGIVVDVYGRKMQEDFEPVIERRFHYFVNYAQGVWHMGQRDIIWVRISKAAFQAGFRVRHFGDILYAKIKSEFANVIDRVQVTIYTEEDKVLQLREEARQVYARRDARLKELSDEAVDTFYSCTLCQTFAPTHVCIVLPERVGLCGAVSWLDAKAAYEINPHGCNQPVPKKGVIDEWKGQWETCNQFIYEHSRGSIEAVNFYTIMEYPLTSCGCFEAIMVILPECNGFMIVNREYPGMTPCGMTFSTLAGSVGGGVQTPGFMGIGKSYLASKKFVRADGGLARVVWMPKEFKAQMRSVLEERAEEEGLGRDFVEKIADETVGVTTEEILPFLEEKGHPALTMDPLF